jgi:hypothetical protein
MWRAAFSLRTRPLRLAGLMRSLGTLVFYTRLDELDFDGLDEGAADVLLAFVAGDRRLASSVCRGRDSRARYTWHGSTYALSYPSVAKSCTPGMASPS